MFFRYFSQIRKKANQTNANNEKHSEEMGLLQGSGEQAKLEFVNKIGSIQFSI